MQAIDYKQRLLAEIDDLPPDELERIYKVVVFTRDEFIDMSGEERYYSSFAHFFSHSVNSVSMDAESQRFLGASSDHLGHPK